MNKYLTENKKIFSFDKSFSTNITFSQPDKYKLLEKISHTSDNLINIGSNLSYSPLGFSRESLSINIKNFDRILHFDKREKTITVEAGLTLIEFLNFTLKHNLWIPQLPGYPTITIGGAVAANAHGKSCGKHGTIRKSIKSILLFHKTHGWLNLSEDKNKEIFDLTIGGIGLTGTIVSVTFELTEIKSSKFITKKKEVNSVEDSLKFILDESKDASYTYTWNRADNLSNFGKGIVYKNYLDQNLNNFEKLKEEKNQFKPFIFPMWNKFSVNIINSLYFKLNKLTKSEKNENFLNVIFPFYGKENYFNFFGKKGFIESQLLVSEEKLNSFIEEFKNLFEKFEPTITLFSLKNMSGKQKFLRFEDNKICLTFDYVNNKKNLLFMSKIDNLYNKYNITPSIIKDSRISKEILRKSYNEELTRFKDELFKFDKKRIYQSEISNRLEI
jgi:decaprenylphospho-beta-D-ribofuranose 2-oxidase